MPLVSILGDKYLLGGACFLGIIFGRKGIRRAAILGFLSIFLTGILVEILKRLIQRPRPDIALQGLHVLLDRHFAGKGKIILGIAHSGFSFPSGHAAAAFAFATAHALNYPRLGNLALSIALLVGFSRIYMGLHYPSDVLAGAILGSAVSAAVFLGYKARRSLHDIRRE